MLFISLQRTTYRWCPQHDSGCISFFDGATNRSCSKRILSKLWSLRAHCFAKYDFTSKLWSPLGVIQWARPLWMSPSPALMGVRTRTLMDLRAQWHLPLSGTNTRRRRPIPTCRRHRYSCWNWSRSHISALVRWLFMTTNWNKFYLRLKSFY